MVLERRGRSDIVAWIVPSLSGDPSAPRFVGYEPKEQPKSDFDFHCRSSLEFLERTGPAPRTLLVLVWHERTRQATVRGFLSTAVQFGHPTVVFANECRSLPPPLLRPTSVPSWEDLLDMQSPGEVAGDERLLAEAIVRKAHILRAVLDRRPLEPYHLRDLDAGPLRSRVQPPAAGEGDLATVLRDPTGGRTAYGPTAESSDWLPPLSRIAAGATPRDAAIGRRAQGPTTKRPRGGEPIRRSPVFAGGLPQPIRCESCPRSRATRSSKRSRTPGTSFFKHDDDARP